MIEESKSSAFSARTPLRRRAGRACSTERFYGAIGQLHKACKLRKRSRVYRRRSGCSAFGNRACESVKPPSRHRISLNCGPGFRSHPPTMRLRRYLEKIERMAVRAPIDSNDGTANLPAPAQKVQGDRGLAARDIDLVTTGSRPDRVSLSEDGCPGKSPRLLPRATPSPLSRHGNPARGRALP